MHYRIKFYDHNDTLLATSGLFTSGEEENVEVPLNTLYFRLEPFLPKYGHLLGKQVRILQQVKNEVVCTGRLLGYTEDGGFQLMSEDGTLQFGWPLLAIEEITEQT